MPQTTRNKVHVSIAQTLHDTARVRARSHKEPIASKDKVPGGEGPLQWEDICGFVLVCISFGAMITASTIVAREFMEQLMQHTTYDLLRGIAGV